jgi:hypothetical protein
MAFLWSISALSQQKRPGTAPGLVSDVMRLLFAALLCSDGQQRLASPACDRDACGLSSGGELVALGLCRAQAQ